MWQKWTERARRVVFFAQQEAVQAHRSSVSPELLLLGLVSDEENVALTLLAEQGITSDRVKAGVRPHIQKRDKPSGDMELSAEAKVVVDMCYEEARQLNDNYIGTEHLLLGLMRDEGIAGSVLSGFGLNVEKMREQVRQLQASK
jgi:ATP-dependent Clp protease ATP-binding subunit ClpC